MDLGILRSSTDHTRSSLSDRKSVKDCSKEQASQMRSTNEKQQNIYKKKHNHTTVRQFGYSKELENA